MHHEIADRIFRFLHNTKGDPLVFELPLGLAKLHDTLSYATWLAPASFLVRMAMLDS